MKQYLSLSKALKTKVHVRMIPLFLVLFIAYEVQAQFYPYNPYNPYNQGYALGQQIGNTIQRNTKYGRNQLRKAIKKWGECNNGTLSLEHGAVALYGSNGYFCSAAVDDRISSKLKSINKSGGTINDVNITENGNFIVVFNDKEWYGVLPSALKSALDDYSYGTKFRSISFNESGTYAITTSDGFKSNNAIYQSFYDDNVDEYGELFSVNISGDGAVFCYSDGTRYCGRIPDKVETAMRNFSHTAKFVKFNRHGDYLICDKYGSYSYSIGDADARNNASTVYFDWSKERIKKAKEKAYAKWNSKAYYKFNDEQKVHRVWCGVENIDGKYVSLETVISTNYNAAPTFNIDFNVVSETDFDGILGNLSDEGLKNMSLKIELANGETIQTNEMAIFKSWLGIGFRLSTSLVSMRSDKRSLRGDISSIQYLVGQFSTTNIKSVTFKGRHTVSFSGIDTKSQLCYDFFRLADESGKSNILPN
ncbi:MAG: hypothetical protein IKZ48_03420 [Prevotella sp.]|nr:hypothetical protein [Prevotella sp.]